MKNVDDQTQTETSSSINDDDVSPSDDRGRNLPVFEELEHFTDCAGVIRSFDLTIHDVPGAGFSGHAHEVTTASGGHYVIEASACA